MECMVCLEVDPKKKLEASPSLHSLRKHLDRSSKRAKYIISLWTLLNERTVHLLHIHLQIRFFIRKAVVRSLHVLTKTVWPEWDADRFLRMQEIVKEKK